MGCFDSIGNIFLVVVNALFVVFGLLLIVPGAVMLADVTYINEKVVPLMRTINIGSFNAADLADGLAITMIIVGTFVLLISLLGICGACKKKRTCLCLYSTIVLTLLAIKVIGIILWVLMSAEVQNYLKSQLLSQLQTRYTYADTTSDEISTAFNFMFMTLECCAVNAVTGTVNDFDASPWVTLGNSGSQHVPIYCCSGINENSAGASFTACTDNVSSGVNAIGCYDALYNMVVKYSAYYIAVGVTILIIEILAVIFACSMCKNIGKTEDVKC